MKPGARKMIILIPGRLGLRVARSRDGFWTIKGQPAPRLGFRREVYRPRNWTMTLFLGGIALTLGRYSPFALNGRE